MRLNTFPYFEPSSTATARHIVYTPEAFSASLELGRPTSAGISKHQYAQVFWEVFRGCILFALTGKHSLPAWVPAVQCRHPMAAAVVSAWAPRAAAAKEACKGTPHKLSQYSPVLATYQFKDRVAMFKMYASDSIKENPRRSDSV